MQARAKKEMEAPKDEKVPEGLDRIARLYLFRTISNHNQRGMAFLEVLLLKM